MYLTQINKNLSRPSMILLIGLFLLNSSFQKPGGFQFRKMLVEYAPNPINIDEAHPRFSWIISSSQRNQVQSAYQIMVATSAYRLRHNNADLWNSGKIISNETIQHEYEKNNLRSNSIYFWKVIFWDGNGHHYESPIGKFETAFLNQDEWKAHWIGKGPAFEALPERGFYKDVKEQLPGKDSVVHDGRSLLLRHEVTLTKVIKSARAYITGLGYYEFFINGKRVGDHVLAPAKTPYQKYVLYDTYDVTALLKQGENAMGIHLGNGWYNPYKKWWNDYRMQWFGSKKAIAQILVTYNDGASEWICTGKDWRWAYGPITYDCVYDGEVYDATQDHSGWTTAGYDDSDWKEVTVFEKPKSKLVSQTMPAIKEHEIFKPKEISVPLENTKVFDMGQNFAGWVSIKTKGPKNTILKLRFAEDIHPDGTIDVTSNENAKATAEYILKGEGIESYQTHFSFFGFRYVEISAQKGPLNILNVEGHAVYSDNQPAGSFGCDDQLVDKIHRATVWSQKSNMLGYPMDCPQRDERLGWFGDAQVTADEAMFNFDMALFYKNWFDGIRENQNEKTGDIPIISPRPYIKDEGIEWSSTYLVMLWKYYINYGDQRILAENYRAMKRYMSFLDSLATDLILPSGWIGDWGSMVKGWKEGDPKSVPTAYYFWNAKIMSKVAAILGNHADQEHFRKLAEAIRKKYNAKFLNTGTANYEDGSQMANAFPLFLGIIPENLKSRVLSNLVKDIVMNNNMHLTTGVLGTKYMPEALAQLGRADVAWGVINQKSAPSWNEMMRRYTTVCEFWTLKQSKNHVMMGSIDAWFYRYIAGIQSDQTHPAFSSFIVKPPFLDNLSSAKSQIETMRGRISSQWKKDKEHFTLKVDIPFNTTATVYLRARKNEKITEGAIPLGQVRGIENIGYKNGAYLIRIHSGKYVFNTYKNKIKPRR